MPFKPYLTLVKPVLSLAVAFTAFTGYVFAWRSIDAGAMTAFLGVLLMALAASALNQVLERERDALMERTKHRPIADGAISWRLGTILGILLALSGSILLLSQSLWAAFLGAFNLFWYLGVYTTMKQKSVYAPLVGTLTGAIPFLMGYMSASTSQPIGPALFISLFLIIWQIPHFLLLVVKYGKEYEKAGLASLSGYWTIQTLRRVSWISIIASSISMLLLPLFGITTHVLTSYILALLSIALIAYAIFKYPLSMDDRSTKPMIILVNLTQFILMLVLIFDSLQH